MSKTRKGKDVDGWVFVFVCLSLAMGTGGAVGYQVGWTRGAKDACCKIDNWMKHNPKGVVPNANNKRR